ADAGARLRGLTAVLTRAGLELPEELAPGEPAERLCELAGAGARVRHVEGAGGSGAEEGLPRAHRLALAEVAVGLPVAGWGVRRRSAGWAALGVLLMVHGALELSYETVFPRD
ncbi:hypothetical protein ABT404_48795, partial [Streptomyces hyaluromycini]